MSAMTSGLRDAIDTTRDQLGALVDALHWAERNPSDGRVWHAIETAHAASTATTDTLDALERKHRPDRARAAAGGR